MREIEDRLWIGNARDARNIRELHDREIRAVVDLAIEEKPVEMFPRELVYLRIPLIDGAGNPVETIALAIQVTSQLIAHGAPTLVACSGGMSRSPAIAAAALASHNGESPDECLQRIVQDHPHDVLPQLWSAVVDARKRLSS